MNSNNDDRNDMENGITVDPLEQPGEGSLGPTSPREFLASKVNDVQFPLVLVLSVSVILLIAVTMGKGGSGYSVSVPVISICLSLTSILMTVFRENLYTIYGQRISQFLLMWNFTGACFLTFKSPFTTTGNGYFAAWGCVIASAMAMGLTADVFKSKIKGVGALSGLCASAAILVIALISEIGGDDTLYRNCVFAMVISCFTIVLVVGLIYFQKQNDNNFDHSTTESIVKFAFLSVFAILWSVMACLLTFQGPFATTGNGYFASWAGAVCASFAAFNAKKESGISTAAARFAGSNDNTVLSKTIT